jgi:hypothetical protein
VRHFFAAASAPAGRLDFGFPMVRSRTMAGVQGGKRRAKQRHEEEDDLREDERKEERPCRGKIKALYTQGKEGGPSDLCRRFACSPSRVPRVRRLL